MTGSGAPPQSSSKQAAGVALEDQQWVIHVLAVATIEEAQLLLPMSRVVGRVDIEQDLAAFRTCSPQTLTNQSSKASCRRMISRAEARSPND